MVGCKCVHARTAEGLKAITEIRNGILASGQLGVIKQRMPQLASIDQEDWSVAERHLASCLHTALSGRWEKRNDSKYTAEAATAREQNAAESGEKGEWIAPCSG